MSAQGVRCKDGVVLGFEKLVISKMLVEVYFVSVVSVLRFFFICARLQLRICFLSGKLVLRAQRLLFVCDFLKAKGALP